MANYKQAYLRMLNQDFTEGISKRRNYNNIRRYFDTSEEGEYTIDNQTWDDLDMDEVFGKLDRTYSSLGESALYHMLRNPIMDEKKLKERDSFIELFKDNANLRTDLQYIFLKLGLDKKNSFLDMLENNLLVNKAKYYLYTFLGKIVPVIFILLSIFVDVKYMMALLGSCFINMIINNYETKNVKSNGLVYLRDILKAAKKVSNIKGEELFSYTDKLKELIKDVRAIDRGVKFISLTSMWGGFFDTISLMFLLEESAYYKIASILEGKKGALMELYYILGELEALVSISGYQYSLEDKCVKPRFVEELTLKVTEGVHPLIENAVANSIQMRKKGIILTGTNMSGKSTFLRMLGVNILLAQTFYFVLAKDYEASFFNIVSSISPNDDLTSGKSFYMAEAESLLRIIKATEKGIPVFCPIDEIFRGTNPVERISASAEILTYINTRNSISIVATHDRELADILKDNYEFYYFSEEVDSEEGLKFDYKLKKGITQTKNAIKLLKYIGYPQEIVDNSYKRAESIEGFI